MTLTNDPNIGVVNYEDNSDTEDTFEEALEEFAYNDAHILNSETLELAAEEIGRDGKRIVGKGNLYVSLTKSHIVSDMNFQSYDWSVPLDYFLFLLLEMRILARHHQSRNQDCVVFKPMPLAVLHCVDI